MHINVSLELIKTLQSENSSSYITRAFDRLFTNRAPGEELVGVVRRRWVGGRGMGLAGRGNRPRMRRPGRPQVIDPRIQTLHGDGHITMPQVWA